MPPIEEYKGTHGSHPISSPEHISSIDAFEKLFERSRSIIRSRAKDSGLTASINLSHLLTALDQQVQTNPQANQIKDLLKLWAKPSSLELDSVTSQLSCFFITNDGGFNTDNKEISLSIIQSGFGADEKADPPIEGEAGATLRLKMKLSKMHNKNISIEINFGEKDDGSELPRNHEAIIGILKTDFPEMSGYLGFASTLINSFAASLPLEAQA